MKTHPQHDYSIESLFDWTPGQVDIPLGWTPQQADAFVSIPGYLEEAIWTLYGDDIIELERSQRLIDVHFSNDDETRSILDDDIPF